jgi:hypothetical protein
VNFTVNKQKHFQTNLPIHNANTGSENHLDRSITNLSSFQKSALHADIDFLLIYLTLSIASTMNEKQNLKLP